MPGQIYPTLRSSIWQRGLATVTQVVASRPSGWAGTVITTVAINDVDATTLIRFGDLHHAYDLTVSVAQGSAELFTVRYEERQDRVAQRQEQVLTMGCGQTVIPTGVAWTSLCTPRTVLAFHHIGEPGIEWSELPHFLLDIG